MAGDGSTDEPPTTTILLNGYNLNSYLFTYRLAQHSDISGEVSLCGEWKSMYKLTTGQSVSGCPATNGASLSGSAFPGSGTLAERGQTEC